MLNLLISVQACLTNGPGLVQRGSHLSRPNPTFSLLGLCLGLHLLHCSPLLSKKCLSFANSNLAYQCMAQSSTQACPSAHGTSKLAPLPLPLAHLSSTAIEVFSSPNSFLLPSPFHTGLIYFALQELKCPSLNQLEQSSHILPWPKSPLNAWPSISISISAEFQRQFGNLARNFPSLFPTGYKINCNQECGNMNLAIRNLV